MIRVRRAPNEPPQLSTISTEEIDRIHHDYPAGPPSRKELGSRFTEVAPNLWKQQNAKCCYCEIKCRHQGNDVEHYRPASLYWWLAWSWENLLFACPNCNRWAKNDKFPLQDPSSKLLPENPPPGAELPLLIDPSAENPMSEIVFSRDAKSGHWMAKARAGSVRGVVTVTLLKLNAPDLMELRDDHIDTQIMPDIEHIRSAMARGDEADVLRRWQTLTLRVLQPTMPYIALSYDAIDHFVPESERTRWGLVLPAP